MIILEYNTFVELESLISWSTSKRFLENFYLKKKTNNVHLDSFIYKKFIIKSKNTNLSDENYIIITSNSSHVSHLWISLTIIEIGFMILDPF